MSEQSFDRTASSCTVGLHDTTPCPTEVVMRLFDGDTNAGRPGHWHRADALSSRDAIAQLVDRRHRGVCRINEPKWEIVMSYGADDSPCRACLFPDRGLRVAFTTKAVPPPSVG